jgi:hypothetical protein
MTLGRQQQETESIMPHFVESAGPGKGLACYQPRTTALYARQCHAAPPKLCCIWRCCACRGELKLGVLVNEVASLDVDSQLLQTQQSNAAAGIKAARLAGGCACCAVAGDLQAALAELAGSPSYQQLDYLVSVMIRCYFVMLNDTPYDIW